ncbi:MAG: nitric oxide reductase activation protein [Candidatus Thiodiazotropha sp. (ex Ctena orbiculata)]|nr:nitric oxide reductase activation protein [Candidatus Thiodiazotropha taylori]MBT2999809.1 nitric oxide reductase activation protein [Candidatus Thiodiazotropha taylori]MBT3028697.1 nitric oxide reductase activation protein [Candidatus Thiodiazotropha taylori]MBT3036326.1 nitric oxide reductase activation protein [Candidatus Thiodiazotropha taylori]MBV2105708.1 nitric oxide reductase activation protein [Candidatus Thiodiazotropha taylori]
MRSQLNLQQIRHLLDDYFEVEYSFRNTREIGEKLVRMEADEQAFVLDWIKRTASTHIEIAYQFAHQAPRALQLMEKAMIEAWLVQGMDIYDLSGLHAALALIRDMDAFVEQGRERAAGSVFDEQVGVLLPFVQGLSGRKLTLEKADTLHTDGEVILLPAVMAHLPRERDNFLLYKAAVAYHWAQVRFGTFRADLVPYLQQHPTPDKALRCFHALETVRLNACIERELPGLYRDMEALEKRLNPEAKPAGWEQWMITLRAPGATAQDSLDLSKQLIDGPIPKPCLFHGQLKPDLVLAVMQRRIEREKARLRVALKAVADDLKQPNADEEPMDRFEISPLDGLELEKEMQIELLVDGKSMPVTDEVKNLLTSIIQDLGEIPEEYLTPAGPGEYDLKDIDEELLKPEDVWSGTYHEDGAYLYKEWDYRRKHYRKNWCVVREMPVKEEHDEFVAGVIHKYRRLLSSLRKTFEAMRDEDRLLKRQTQGDGVDIDAFVEAWADMHSGLEMTDRLFTRMHREERNIAVMFMVDMSGSTQGWVNQAEREALVLLAEALQALGDRYAIYGFTGMSRKRCEVFPVKQFDQPYDVGVRARISGIRAGDYTRMGAAIRHLTHRLNEVEARTKLLVTLSDGKPDDYNDEYRSQYGIEDTRQALFEARRQGVHAFCITIDEEGQDYLPHMYGAANYTVVSEIEKLPLKVSDIYKKITT